MSKTDTLGRATFHHIEKRQGIRPTPREIRWLQHIELHGPQSSLYLHDLTSATHRDPDTSRRMLQKLRAGGLIYCPRQQRATENANFHSYIYDLSEMGRQWLHDRDLGSGAIRPTGHWVHQFMTSCITGSIDIAAQRAGVNYIPAHAILARSGGALGTTIGKKKLIPDQLFGLDYGGQFRFFCVEADRGTEPKSSAAARKSYRSTLEDYRAFIGDKLYKDHYNLTAGMLLLYVFSSKGNERRFHEIAKEVMGHKSSYLLTQTIEGFEGGFQPKPLATHLFDGEWNRVGRPPFCIGQT